MRLGKIEVTPPRVFADLPAQPRERRLSRAEIERLGKTLREVAQDGEHPTGLAAIRFLLLSGFRRMEGLGLQRRLARRGRRRDPLPRHQERRADPRDRAGRR